MVSLATSASVDTQWKPRQVGLVSPEGKPVGPIANLKQALPDGDTGSVSRGVGRRVQTVKPGSAPPPASSARVPVSQPQKASVEQRLDLIFEIPEADQLQSYRFIYSPSIAQPDSCASRRRAPSIQERFQAIASCVAAERKDRPLAARISGFCRSQRENTRNGTRIL